MSRRRVLGVVLVAVVLAIVLLLPVNRWLLAAGAWLRGAGAPGVVAFALLYIVATVLFLPGSVLTLAAGFAYGPLWGTALISPVSVAAAGAAFVTARYLARHWVEQRVSRDARFERIDRAVAQEGFRVVLLLRLSPLFPFNALNYLLGLTRVPLGVYLWASFLGMLPGTVLYVYLGSLITSAAQLAEGAPPSQGDGARRVLFALGLVATLLATFVLTRLARRALAQSLEGSAPAQVGEAAR